MVNFPQVIFFRKLGFFQVNFIRKSYIRIIVSQELLKNDFSTQTSDQKPIEPPTPEAKAMIRAMEKAHKNQARESKDAVFMRLGTFVQNVNP